VSLLFWSAAAVISALVAIDALRDLKHQRRVDRACAEFRRQMEHL
jgi:hypothetical protein